MGDMREIWIETPRRFWHRTTLFGRVVLWLPLCAMYCVVASIAQFWDKPNG